MKPKKRQKLCYNCEGEVDLDVIVCPLCAADLRAEKPELEKSSFSPSVATLKQLHSQDPLYSIPYRLDQQETAPSAESIVLPEEENTEPGMTKMVVITLTLFSLGIHLFLLGALLVLFSERGTMVLKWDASFWFLYILLSLPLLFFGYRYLNKL